MTADPRKPDTSTKEPLEITNLKRWRDVGDGPATYTAGSQQFADDVIVLLREYDQHAPAQLERGSPDREPSDMLSELSEIIKLVGTNASTREWSEAYETRRIRINELMPRLQERLSGIGVPAKASPAWRDIIANWLFSESDRFDLDDFGYDAADDLLSRLGPPDPSADAVTECLNSSGRNESEKSGHLPLTNPPTGTDSPAEMGRAVIKGDRLIIAVDINTLPVVVSAAADLNHWEGDYKVTDAATFAKELVHELNSESDNGTTLIHRMFDEAIRQAVEQGAEGIDWTASADFQEERGQK